MGSEIVMWLGFALASYSVVGNDVIQTLGTFLTSNENRVRWQVLFAFAGGIMLLVLLYGHFLGTDISYGRLAKFSFPETYHWYYLLPPLVLMGITRLGIPVSTTFMILTLFSLSDIPGELGPLIESVIDPNENLGKMIKKSLYGYMAALLFAATFYLIVTRFTEKVFVDNPLKKAHEKYWIVAQWFSTAFLWSQWLTQDLANIYIYLRGGTELSVFQLLFSIVILLCLLAFIFYSKGGRVQDVVREKYNTVDIRSATFIDLFYGLFLLFFKYDSLGLWGGKLPMSTTWIFIGLLAGRELGIRINLFGEEKKMGKVVKAVFRDLLKVTIGLVVSVLLVIIIKMIGG